MEKIKGDTIETLKSWVKDLVYPADPEELIHVTKDFEMEVDGKKGRIYSFYMYTNENKYGISAIERQEDEGYLGGGALARKQRPGEDWNRGNDLIDGPLTLDTWNKILKDIVRYELVRLSKYTKPIGDSFDDGVKRK